jgi:uracil-DNA glycosylase
VLRASTTAKLLIVGQAPGTLVHGSGVPWDDASGVRLRGWLGIDKADFYDESRIAIVPMGFCYPGRGASGDLPPRPECRATWHPRLLPLLPNVTTVLAIGQYAQAWFLGERRKKTLTETVQARPCFPCRIPARATSRGSCTTRGSRRKWWPPSGPRCWARSAWAGSQPGSATASAAVVAGLSRRSTR